ncbi:MAG: cytochrome c-type biogenesis protein [Thermomicrobiaceae bacterium]
MKRSLIGLAISALILVFLPVAVLAEEDLTYEDAPDRALSPQALELANDLNCPICEGQSIRDSNSQLARDMRRTVQEMFDDGYTEDEIRQYFVDRYGVGILREPPKSGFFMTLWWAPVIGVAVGALLLGTFITQRRKTTARPKSDQNDHSADSVDDLTEYEQRVLRDLEDDDESLRDGRR